MALIDIEGIPVDALRTLFSSGANAFRFRGLGPGSSRSALEHVLRDSVLSQFALRDTGSGELLGLVQAILPDFRHGTAQLAAVVATDAQMKGWPLEGVILFINHLFVVHPLRKLYLEVPSMNAGRLGAGMSRFFVTEGTLSSHEWHLGEYRDVTYFSMARESFYSNRMIVRVLDRARGN